MARTSGSARIAARAVLFCGALTAMLGGCGGGDHPSDIRVLGITPGACGAGGSVLFGRVPLRLEPQGLGTFLSVQVRVISGGSVAPMSDSEAPFIVELDTKLLADGMARLGLSAEDSDGENLSREIDVCIDNAGPELSVLSPPPGASIGIEDAKVAVRVSVADPAGIASVTARLSTSGAYQQVVCQPPTAKEQVCTLRPGELALVYEPSVKSEITLTVTARDKVGHERSLKRQLEVGTRLLWRYNAGAPITWRAVVTKTGSVVIGTDTGVMHVVDANGKKLCSVQAPAVSGQADPITTPLTYADIGAKQYVFLATKQTLWALDPTTCKRHWKVGGGLYFASRPAHDPAADVVYIGSYGEVASRGTLRAFRASTGEALGSLPIAKFDGAVTSSPVLSADRKTVYIGSSDLNFYAANVENPSAITERWKFGAGAKIESAPLVTPSAIYVASLSKTLHALDPAGKALPAFSFTAQAGFFSSPMLGPDGAIYVGSLDEKLYAIDPAGKEVASFQTGRMLRTSPVLGPGSLVLAAQTKPGRLYALTNKLELIWSVQPGTSETHEFRATPAVSGNTVYLGSSNGFLYAFDATPPAQ